MIERQSSQTSARAFCVGQAKSGTASLCGLLATRYRAAHEPERAQLLDMILRESRGEVDEEAFRTFLLERDQRLNLEYDIAWANQFIMRHLLTAFPDAKFVVLVRNPSTWLRSIVGHLISRQIPPEVRSFLDWWFQPERYPHTRQDRALQARGIYSIAAYLNAWNRHVDSCTQMLPPQRRLVLRTHELNRSYSRLADFLEVPLESLDSERGHLNRSTWSGRLDSLLDAAYVNDSIGRICGENMARLFPDL